MEVVVTGGGCWDNGHLVCLGTDSTCSTYSNFENKLKDSRGALDSHEVQQAEKQITVCEMEPIQPNSPKRTRELPTPHLTQDAAAKHASTSGGGEEVRWEPWKI